MITLRTSQSQALREMAVVPHKSFQAALEGHWLVDADGRVDARSACWLFCWAKTGMGSVAAAEAAQRAFDAVLSVAYATFDARVPHEWARSVRYSTVPVDRQLDEMLST